MTLSGPLIKLTEPDENKKRGKNFPRVDAERLTQGPIILLPVFPLSPFMRGNPSPHTRIEPSTLDVPCGRWKLPAGQPRQDPSSSSWKPYGDDCPTSLSFTRQPLRSTLASQWFMRPFLETERMIRPPLEPPYRSSEGILS